VCRGRPTSFPPFAGVLFISSDAARAVELLNRHPAVLKWGVHPDAVEIEGLEGDRAHTRAADLLMRRRSGLDGKRSWGEKSPESIFHIPLLSQLFPKARFIPVYQDARDVAISIMPLSWGPNNAYTCARWWASAIGAWQGVRDRLGERGLEVRYEDFVTDPQSGLGTVIEFLGLDYDSRMLEDYPIRADRVGLWRNRLCLSPTEQGTIEGVGGVKLISLGYEVATRRLRIPLGIALFSLLDDGYKRLSNRPLRH